MHSYHLHFNRCSQTSRNFFLLAQERIQIKEEKLPMLLDALFISSKANLCFDDRNGISQVSRTPRYICKTKETSNRDRREE